MQRFSNTFIKASFFQWSGISVLPLFATRSVTRSQKKQSIVRLFGMSPVKWTDVILRLFILWLIFPHQVLVNKNAIFKILSEVDVPIFQVREVYLIPGNLWIILWGPQPAMLSVFRVNAYWRTPCRVVYFYVMCSVYEHSDGILNRCLCIFRWFSFSHSWLGCKGVSLSTYDLRALKKVAI